MEYCGAGVCPRAQSPGNSVQEAHTLTARRRAVPEAAYFAHRLLQSLHRHVGRFSLLGWRSLDFGRVEFVHQLHGEGGEMRTLGVWKQRGCRLLEARGTSHTFPGHEHRLNVNLSPSRSELQRRGNMDSLKHF